ncbi:hypothetical protein BDQ12DRAFT_694072 [Crucibulum laeve]|uniref:F-box domain-containing protein n=1 Tax=Crucibulum laeve TaxID=68775 RepID=A0A5C3LRU8_9AGAR|nr:hypothetical protein BDQ12DRAFT_694072 [Crucibulum laeve]
MMSVAGRTTPGLSTSASASLPHGQAQAQVHTSHPPHGFSKFILNQDVVDIVFQHFGGVHYHMSDLERQLSRNALALAARVCRSFSNAALDHLWRYLDSWLPLLQLLPSFKQSINSYSFCGVVTDDEWAHFDAHARRVRSFSVLWDDVDAELITSYTFVQLAQLHPAPIFPALRLLSFSVSENCNILKVKHIAVGCFLLISPAIKTLIIDKFRPDTMEVREYNAFFEAFFASLVQGSTNIQDLTVDGCIPHWTTLASSCNLRNICFYKSFGQNTLASILMDIKSLQSFSDLTSIKIDVEIMDGYNPEDVQSLLHCVPKLNSSEGLDYLPHLQEMNLVGDITLLVLVLQHIPAKNLKHISIHCMEWINSHLSPLWDRFFEQLSRCQYLCSISILNLIYDVYAASNFAGIISQTHLQSLLKLNHLEALLIRGYGIVDLHEEFIIQAASSWSKLHILCLLDSQLIPRADVSAESLGVLSRIARHYPNLDELELSIHTMDLAITIPSSYHSSSELQKLFLSTSDDVRDLTVPQRLQLARYIYRVFPLLNVVSGTDKEFWEEINATVQAFKAVRQETLSEN